MGEGRKAGSRRGEVSVGKGAGLRDDAIRVRGGAGQGGAPADVGHWAGPRRGR